MLIQRSDILTDNKLNPRSTNESNQPHLLETEKQSLPGIDISDITNGGRFECVNLINFVTKQISFH